MDQEQYQSDVRELLGETAKRVTEIASNSGQGAFVQLSNQGQVNLTTILKNVLKSSLKDDLLKDIQVESTYSPEAEKQNKENFDYLINNITGIMNKKDRSDGNRAGSLGDIAKSSLKEMRNSSYSQLGLLSKVVKFGFQTYEIGKAIFDVAKTIGKKALEQAELSAQFAFSLRESGVLIKEGFDDGFMKYTAMAMKSREDFIELAKENSRFISTMNGAGKNGAEELAKESKKLTGVLSLTAKESNASIKRYNETMMTAANQANISEEDHETNLIKTTKALKMFANATGQSYENLVKERKEREKTWQLQRLATDPKTQAQFAMLKNMGMSDDQIEAIMLGKANKASVMAQLDPDSAAIFNALQSAYRNSKGNPEEFQKALSKISNSSAANNLRARSAGLNMEDMAYFGENMGAIMDPSMLFHGLLSQRFDQEGAEKVEDKEAEILDGIRKVYANLDVFNSKIADEVTPSLKTIGDYLPTVADAQSKLNGLLEQYPWLKKAAGWVGIGSEIAGGLVNSIFSVWLLAKMSGITKIGSWIGSGFKTAISSTIGGIWNVGKWFSGKLFSILSWFARTLPGRLAVGGTLIATGANMIKNAWTGKENVLEKAVGSPINRFLNFLGRETGLWKERALDENGMVLGARDEDLGISGMFMDEEERKKEIAKRKAETARKYKELYGDPALQKQKKEEALDEDVPVPSQPAVSAAKDTVDVDGMDKVEDLLKVICKNTSALLSEWRNGGFDVGTNLAG